MKKLFLLISLSVLMISCSSNVLFSQYFTLPNKGWEADSVITFNVDITDTISTYDIIIDVRHYTDYPYQNMWLFVNSDTIDFYLANYRGEWLGNGGSDLREMPVLYKSEYKFQTPGTYTYVISQAMRDKRLRGIRDIGLIIEKH